MQLRKCCNHPFLIKEIEQDLVHSLDNNPQERFQKLLESSGKMMLLDKLLVKLIREGNRVLIFSQFTKMLDLLEEYLQQRGYKYEKIDGSVKSKERQNAIDRFNSNEKKRDVFILSTKAGGLGINLTSANVVIIFDSDWNPQNDVQATARAHRIGQINEVKAYRLITRNTYEAQMFERATKKLGLDQAIFMGGDYQTTTNNNYTNNNSIQTKKISNNEIETLLKKGILGFLDDDNHNKNHDHNHISQQQSYFDNDIEQILEKNSRIAKYSLINSNFTIAKSSYVSKNSDTSININDPLFWQNILKSQESESKKYLKKLQDQTLIKEYKDTENQKQLIQWTGDNVNKIIQSKLNVQQFNVDEENNIIQILQIIMTSPNIFIRQYRDLVGQWIDEIEKPSRRFKMLNIKDIDLKNNKKINILQQYSEESSKEELGINNLDENNYQDSKKQVSNKEKEERLRKLCAYCERSRCLYMCEGMCKRSFHEQCVQEVFSKEQICGKDSNEISFELNEKKQNDEKLKRMLKLGWECKDCERLLTFCFICKEESGIELMSTTFTAHNILKCSISNCHKYYHLHCLKNDKNSVFISKNHAQFKCPLHLCRLCNQQGELKHMVSCFRCPTTYHNTCLPNHLPKISKKFILCSNHQKPNNNKSKFVIKLQMQEKDDQNDAFKIKKAPQRLIKTKSQITKQSESKINNNDLIETKINNEKQSKINNQNKKLTYEDFGICSPHEFDYINYKNDWCRYCGTRFSSNFTKGPWAPRTLCTVHYIDWSQKQKLNLDGYPNLPLKPIDISQNSELEYINKTRMKNPEYNPQYILNESPRIKKVKIEKEISQLK